tara:strand:+ start:1961 stop:3301 length:1341 start_codon:yes stop_codon:yes gene_type:complete
MQRCNLCLVLLLLLSTQLLSQDIDCEKPLSTASMDSLSYHGIGVHSSEDIDILKESALTALVLDINSKVNTELNISVDESIEDQKKKFLRRKNKKKETFDRQASKSTTISSEIVISEYTFSSIQQCNNQYYLVASLNKNILREKTRKQALVFIDNSTNLIQSSNSIKSKLSDIDNLYKEMDQFSDRLKIIDSYTTGRFNASKQSLKDQYKKELSTISIDYSLTPELTHHLNRDSVLNVKIGNSYQTMFDNVSLELKIGDFSQLNELDNKSATLFDIGSKNVKNIDNFSLVLHLEDTVRNHSLFQSLGLTDPTFVKVITRKKVNVFADLSCDEEVKAFVNKDYANFIDRLKNNYQVNMVNNVQDADLIIDIDCTNENIRKNSFDIYILQFQLSGKTNLYGESTPLTVESPFLDEKSFIGYKKAYANMSSTIILFFEDFYGKIEDLLL